MERWQRLRRVATHMVAGDTCAAAAAAPSASSAGVDNSILAGVKVIDLSTVIAGPACAAMMADFGASVTKIEPPGGDSWRSAGAMFEQDNRGKRSVCLDLSSDDGHEIFLQLLKTTDVVVTNMRGPALKKLRCDYESLKCAK
eukprot:COSAG02_NODE_21418_length_788_cov_1.759071_1_plen_141_part_10